MASRTFPAWPGSVPAARGYVTDLLQGIPPGLCQTAALLVSELATNVVRHSGAATFDVEVDYSSVEGRLWVGITDAGSGEPVPRSPSVTTEHGRGLQLVATFADRWGARRRRGEEVKTVWFELAVPPPR
jgi:anti-sigma regulatory factor (Ser/Thr protein kinase)